MIKIKDESQFLDADFRKAAIEAFEKDVERVSRSQMRQDIYNDKTKKYVISAMVQESSDASIRKDIENRASNISFAKKIIKKKAMIYKDGAVRTSTDESRQPIVDDLTDLLNVNMVMKKTNRYSEMHRNAIVGCLPYKNELTQKYYLKARPFAPHEYFPVIDSADMETLRAVVIPYGVETEMVLSGEASRGKRNGKNEVVGKKVKASNYIWWTNFYHFTTNNKGEIIEGLQDENFANPIKMLPFADFSQIKDGTFEVEGGDDLFESSLLLNILLTDMYYITKYQGMGLGYLFGKGVPKNLKVGPSSFISLEVESGDPTPSIGFATSNPPIDAHIRQVEQQLAMLLSTNSLSAGTIAGTLDANNAESGAAKVIDRSELTEDIDDQKEIYRDGEPILYNIACKWIKTYGKNKLDDKFAKLYFDQIDKMEVKVEFEKAVVYTSEEEKLRVIEKRLDLGLDDQYDAIKRDNPALTEEEIQKKIERTKIKVEINGSDEADRPDEVGAIDQE